MRRPGIKPSTLPSMWEALRCYFSAEAISSGPRELWLGDSTVTPEYATFPGNYCECAADHYLQCEKCVEDGILACQFVRQMFANHREVGWSSHCVHCMWVRQSCKLPDPPTAVRSTVHFAVPSTQGSTSQKRKDPEPLSATAPVQPPEKRARIAEAGPSRAPVSASASAPRAAAPKRTPARRPPGVPVGTPFEEFVNWPGTSSGEGSSEESSAPSTRTGKRSAAVTASQRIHGLYGLPDESS